MREREIQFHSKIEAVQNILSKIVDRLCISIYYFLSDYHLGLINAK